MDNEPVVEPERPVGLGVGDGESVKERAEVEKGGGKPAVAAAAAARTTAAAAVVPSGERRHRE